MLADCLHQLHYRRLDRPAVLIEEDDIITDMTNQRKNLFQPPCLRTNKENEHRHARWQELFYDLVFAAVVSQMDVHFSTHYTLRETLRFLVVLVPVWWAWVGQTFYLSRFDSEDMGHTLLILVQILLAAHMALQIPAALNGHAAEFVRAYCAIRMVLALEYFRAGWYIREARSLTWMLSFGYIIAVALWLVSIAMPMHFKVLMRITAIVLELVIPFVRPKLQLSLPVHASHIPERMSQFTIVLVGEAVYSAITAPGPAGMLSGRVLIGISGLILAFTFTWSYFDGVQAAGERQMRNLKESWKFRQWLYLHLPLTFFLITLAAGIRHLLAMPPFKAVPYFHCMLVSIAAAGMYFCINLLFITRINRPSLRRVRKAYTSHLALSAGCVIPLFLPHPNPFELVGIPCLMGILGIASSVMT